MSIIISPGGHRLGYRKANKFHSMKSKLTPLPQVTVSSPVDLRSFFPGISNQGQEGACTAFGTCEAYETIYGSINQKVIPVRRSKAFAYAVTRMAEGTFPSDSGATMADEFACGQADGFCSEPLLPYEANPAEAPTPACYTDAAQWKLPSPTLVPGDQSSMQQVLTFGRPIGISLGVTAPFENVGSDGKIAVPAPEDQVLGGHGLCLLGWNTYGWIVANSWSTIWGDGGFCYLQFGWEKLFWELYTDVSDHSAFVFGAPAAAA